MAQRDKIGLGGVNENVGGFTVSASPLTGSAGVRSPTAGSGDVHASIGAGVNLGGVPSVSPNILVGHTPNAAMGGKAGGAAGGIGGGLIGGPVGAGVGAGVGSAIGSTVGSLIGGGGNKDHEGRNSLRGNITGALGGDEFALPDGTTANFTLDAHDGLHDFKYGDKRTDQQGNQQLHAYDTDYTNDLDYLAGMGGTTLSRLINGGKSKNVDQLGGLIGNQSLGSVGFGKDLTQDNFSKVMGNQRAMYAQAGIQNKEQMVALANTAYSQGRINDADHAAALQTANLVFGGDFNLANQLSSGRWAGVKTAAATPSGQTQLPSSQPQNRAGRIYSPIISPDEAVMSVQPYIDLYKKSKQEGYDSKINKGMQTGASIAQGVALATGLYSIGNKLTDNALGGWIKQGGQFLGGGLRDLATDVFGGGQAADLGSIDTGSVGGTDAGDLASAASDVGDLGGLDIG